jgi:hypothetical protein
MPAIHSRHVRHNVTYPGDFVEPKGSHPSPNKLLTEKARLEDGPLFIGWGTRIRT